MRHFAISLLFLSLVGAVAPTAGMAQENRPVLAVDLRSTAAGERLQCMGLQGIANRAGEGPRVFLIFSDGDREWLDYCLRLSSAEEAEVSPAELLELLKGRVAGQVLYDPAQPYTVELAITAAGIRDLVMSATDLGLPTIFDFRGRWRSAAGAYHWALEALLPECDSSAAVLLPSGATGLADLAVQRRLFALGPPEDPREEMFQSVMFRLPPGAAVYGGASAEIENELSRSSHYLVRAAEAVNLSFFSSLGGEGRQHQYLGYVEPNAVRYLTLIFDCSDLDFAINKMPALWASPTRGTLSLGWALPGSLAELGQPVARRYFADAYWSGSDQFVLGGSGVGTMDLGVSTAPYTFLQKTSAARAALDMPASLYSAASAVDIGEHVLRFAAATGVGGVFLTDCADLPPTVYGEVAAIAAPRVTSVAQAITYLNRVPLDRRCVALVLDPRYLTPREAAEIAAHVSDRYVVLPPGEMVEMLRELGTPSAGGSAGVLVSAADYGEPSAPTAPIPVTARVEPVGEVGSAMVVYFPAGHPLVFSEPMRLTEEGSYTAMVPPLLQGGEIVLRVRAKDRQGRATWSPTWSVTVPRTDADEDGLSDAEEDYLLTDAASPDTDGDGIMDSSDRAPRRFDTASVTLAGPIVPPDDLPYVAEAGGSYADLQGRHVAPGESCVYRLPVPRAAPGTPGAVAMIAHGPATVSVRVGENGPEERFEGRLEGTWQRGAVVVEGGEVVEVVVACPAEAQEELIVRSVSLVSPAGSPSIDDVSVEPRHPGPEYPIVVSARVFSPRGVAEAELTYRVNGGGRLTMPMLGEAGSPWYRARIPAMDNRAQVEYWIAARDGEGGETVTVPASLSIGSYGRETVSALACREFVGDWSSEAEAGKCFHRARGPGLKDSAWVNLRGGVYTVWLLGGGRGQGLDLFVRNGTVGSVDPEAPDGWQRLGRVRLEEGRHEVSVVSRAEPGAPAEAAARYAEVIFTTDTTLTPPANEVLEVYDSIALLSPAAGDTLSGRVDLLATGAGNITGAEFSLDREVLRRTSGPPFRYSLSAERLPPGPHTLRVEAVDSVGPTGLAVEIPVTVAE